MKKSTKKSKVERRGGARVGAGRPPKPRAPQIPLRLAPSDTSAQDLARRYLALAIEVLASIAGEGASEAARVAAARAVVEIAAGKAKAAQAGADQHQDDDDSGWGDLLDRRPAGRAN